MSAKPHTHWLYGRGPDKVLVFKCEVDRETDCGKCAHDHVCSHKMEALCINHDRGRAAGEGCTGCSHSYTRYDRQPVPCFHCPDFLPLASLQFSLSAGDGRAAALNLTRRQQADIAFAALQIDQGAELVQAERWRIDAADRWFRNFYVKTSSGEDQKSVFVDFQSDSSAVSSIRLSEYHVVIRHDRAA